MAKRNSKSKQGNNSDSTPTRSGAVSPVGYKKPPVEHRFKKGQTGNPHGRPRTISELRERLLEIGAEPIASDPKMTRLDLFLRGMFASKAPADRKTILEYAFGKVPLPIGVMDWRQEAETIGYDPDELYNAMAEAARARLEAAAAMGTRSGDGRGVASGEAAGGDGE